VAPIIFGIIDADFFFYEIQKCVLLETH